VDPGFDSTNVITAGLPIPDKRFPDPAGLNAYLRQILSSVESLPAVRDVALTSALPMQGWGYFTWIFPANVSTLVTVSKGCVSPAGRSPFG
jgi:hypothetical protein